MKKILSVMTTAALALSIVACGGSKPKETEKPADAPAETSAEASAEKPADAPAGNLEFSILEDGIYKTEGAESNGWKSVLQVEAKEGKIVTASYDAIKVGDDEKSGLKDGDLKSKTTEETYPMNPQPSEWIQKINLNVLKASSIDTVDAVAGATQSSGDVKALLGQILSDPSASFVK